MENTSVAGLAEANVSCALRRPVKVSVATIPEPDERGLFEFVQLAELSSGFVVEIGWRDGMYTVLCPDGMAYPISDLPDLAYWDRGMTDAPAQSAIQPARS